MLRRGATIQELFPGNMGGIRLATVTLRLNRPELMTMPRDEPLSEELRELVLRELARMEKKA
jgi:hypothetical protein